MVYNSLRFIYGFIYLFSLPLLNIIPVIKKLKEWKQKERKCEGHWILLCILFNECSVYVAASHHAVRSRGIGVLWWPHLRCVIRYSPQCRTGSHSQLCIAHMDSKVTTRRRGGSAIPLIQNSGFPIPLLVEFPLYWRNCVVAGNYDEAPFDHDLGVRVKVHLRSTVAVLMTVFLRHRTAATQRQHPYLIFFIFIELLSPHI